MCNSSRPENSQHHASLTSQPLAGLLIAVCSLALPGCGGEEDNFGPLSKSDIPERNGPPNAQAPVVVEVPEATTKQNEKPTIDALPAKEAVEELDEQVVAETDPAVDPGNETLAISLTHRERVDLSEMAARRISERGQVTRIGSDSQWLIGQSNSPIAIFESQSQQIAKRLYGMQGEFAVLAANATGRIVAAGTMEGTIKVWQPGEQVVGDYFAQLQQARLEASLPSIDAHKGPVRVIKFLSDQRLMTAGEDGTVRFWAIPFSDPALNRKVAGMFADIERTAGGQRVLVRNGLDIKSLSLQSNERPEFTFELPGESAARVNVSADGDWLTSFDSTQTVRLIHLNAGQVTTHWKHRGAPLTAVVADPISTNCYATTEDGELIVWAGFASKQTDPFHPPIPERSESVAKDTGTLIAVLHLPSGEANETDQIAQTTGEADAVVEDQPAAAQKSKSQDAGPYTVEADTVEAEQMSFTAQLAFLVRTADGQLRLLDEAGEQIRKWSDLGLSDGKLLLDRQHHRAVVFGRRAGATSSIKLINLLEPKVVSLNVGAGVVDVLWQGDQSAWVAHQDGAVIRHQLPDGLVLDRYELEHAAVVFAPSENGVFVLDAANQVWLIQTRLLRALKAHQSAITAAELDEDSSRLVTGSADGSVIVWNSETLQPQAEFNRLTDGAVTDVAVLPSDQVVASYEQNRICLWNMLQTTAAAEEPLGATAPVEQTESNGGVPGIARRGIQEPVTTDADEDQDAGSASDPAQKRNPEVVGDLPAFEYEPPMTPWTISVNPAGKLLAAGCEDRQVVIWELPEDRQPEQPFATAQDERRRFAGHRDAVVDVEFLGDESLAIVDRAHEVRRWQLQPVTPNVGVQRPLESTKLPFEQLSNDVVWTNEDSTQNARFRDQMALRRARDGEHRLQLRTELKLLPAKTTIASAEVNLKEAEFQFDDLKPAFAQENVAVPRPTVKQVVSAGGDTLVALIEWPAARGQQPVRRDLRVWDVPTGIELRRWQAVAVAIDQMGVSTDGRWIWAAQIGVGLYRFDISTGEQRWLEVPVSAVAYDAQHDRLLVGLEGVAGESSATLQLIDLPSLRVAAEMTGFESTVPAVAFIDKTNWAVASVRERNQARLLLLNRETLDQVSVLHDRQLAQPWTGRAAGGQEMGFDLLFLSPNGRVLLTHGHFGVDGYLSIIWNQSRDEFKASSKSPLDRFQTKRLIEQSVEKGPNGFYVDPAARFAVRVSRGFSIVDLRSNASRRLVEVDFGARGNPVYQHEPEGRFLAVGQASGKVEFLHVRSERNPKILDAHNGPVISLTFSADSERFATAGEEGVIKVWRLKAWLDDR